MVAVPVTDTAYGHIATIEEENHYTDEGYRKVDTEDAVRSYFSDIPVLVQIARCESQFRHTLPDGSVLKGNVDSADTGVMQINTRYHGENANTLGLDLTDMYDNMAYARDLYGRQGTQPWSASAQCWDSSIAMR
jgi:hypothetical protein